MFKKIIENKFKAIFGNLAKQEETKNHGIYIFVNDNKEIEAYLFKNGKKDRKLTIDDITKLMD